MARKRHLSRIAVMQVLFEREQRTTLLESGKAAGKTIDTASALAKNTEELGEIDTEFAQALLEGVLSLEDDLRSCIEKYAPEWDYDNMDPIARPVLLIGAYELLHADDAPPAVVMNECIEIAKHYGTEETGKFVNGVLNAIAKK